MSAALQACVFLQSWNADGQESSALGTWRFFQEKMLCGDVLKTSKVLPAFSPLLQRERKSKPQVSLAKEEIPV